eukprot:128530-Amphidinium_carterae.1
MPTPVPQRHYRNASFGVTHVHFHPSFRLAKTLLAAIVVLRRFIEQPQSHHIEQTLSHKLIKGLCLFGNQGPDLLPSPSWVATYPKTSKGKPQACELNKLGL